MRYQSKVIFFFLKNLEDSSYLNESVFIQRTNGMSSKSKCDQTCDGAAVLGKQE